MTPDEQLHTLRRALVRLLWKSVADDAECSCDEWVDGTHDPCPECEAFRALGFGDWPGYEAAGDKLLEVTR